MEEESEMMPMEGKQNTKHKLKLSVWIIANTQTSLFMW